MSVAPSDPLSPFLHTSPFTTSDHQSTHQGQTKMGPSLTSQLLAVSRAAFCTFLIQWTIICGLLLALKPDPYEDYYVRSDVITEQTFGEFFHTAVYLSKATALLLLAWNLTLFSCLYILAVLDAALFHILKLFGRKSDISVTGVTQKVTSFVAWYSGITRKLGLGLIKEIFRDDYCSMCGCNARHHVDYPIRSVRLCYHAEATPGTNRDDGGNMPRRRRIRNHR